MEVMKGTQAQQFPTDFQADPKPGMSAKHI
jgi:hypothetical protein